MKRRSPGKIAGFALGCCLLPLLACASVPGSADADAVLMIGEVRVYGSAPRTYAAITGERDGKLYLIDDPDMEKELRALQGRRLEFTVRFMPAPHPYPPADGMVSVISYRPAAGRPLNGKTAD